MKNNRGFTITEIVIVLAIMGVLTPFVMSQMGYFEDKNTATIYADQTKGYAKSFMRMIQSNYGSYYQYAQTNPNTIQVIKYSDLAASGMLPAGLATKNALNQTPCVAMQFNAQTKQLQSVMFYVDNGKVPSKLDKLFGHRAASIGGGEFGVVQPDNTVLGSGKGWVLDSTSELLKGASGCDYSHIAPYGLVVNLTMLSDYPNNLDPTQYLSRVKDSANDPNSQTNANTMQTDIVMDSKDAANNSKYSGVYLNYNTTPNQRVLIANGRSAQLSQNNKDTMNAIGTESANAVVVSGDAYTNSLVAQGTTTSFTPCLPVDSGKMKKQADQGAIVTNQLQCTYNPLQCKNASQYCYLPIMDVATRYHINQAQFTCPQGYVDPSVSATATNGAAPANFNGGKWECWASFLGACTNWQYVTRNECSWASPTTTINNLGGDANTFQGYTIYRSVSATSTWQPASNGYDCNYSGKNNQAPGILQTVTCTTANPVIDYTPQ